MGRMLIFGLGYSASRIRRILEARGWQVDGTSREAAEDRLRFDDRAVVLAALAKATHILSSVPPDDNGVDPVLTAYGEPIACAPARWIGYLSSTGVYGDTGGAWVDEGAPLRGRRAGRIRADENWRALRNDVRRFRLPGIYGPGRSALDRVVAGQAHRTGIEGQLFSRIHVDDIAGAVIASLSSAATGAFNIADDAPASQDAVVEAAAAMLRLPPPPVVALDQLSPAARAFYAENRRVANGRAKRLLCWQPRYRHYRDGLSACLGQMATKGTIHG